MNSQEYWKHREEEALKQRITDEKEYDKQIKRIYSDMLDNVQNEINAFYGKYATKEGITIAEAKKRVKELDIEAYERKAKRYVKDKDFSAKANEEMRLYNATMKINRLEMLKANIGLELISGHEELNKFMGGILQGRTEDELKRQAGILGKTIQNNAKTANAIVNASFHNATFSDRIWLYQDLMKADLAKLLQSGLIAGKNPRQLARDLSKMFYGGDPKKDGGYLFCAERLLRTELAKVQTDAQKQSFERNGFDKYIFIVNGGCCAKCEEAAKKDVGYGKGVYLVKDMQAGENSPPMHCFCRCSTAAYEDSEDYEAWLEYLNKGGTTAQWEQLSPETKAKFKKQLTNTVKSDKIFTEIETETSKALKNLNIDYNPVAAHANKMTADEIIKTVAGGDRTTGSCASVALAYAGQKQGWNVLDFRGGKSMDWFSSKFNKLKMWDSLGVKYITEDSGKSNITNGNKLLSKLEKGKEYYLSVGRHASIVRRNEDGVLQYLELQSATRSGWIDFDGNPRYTLKNRFGCSSSSRYISAAYATDISQLTGDDFRTILGYINTDVASQRKGATGYAK